MIYISSVSLKTVIMIVQVMHFKSASLMFFPKTNALDKEMVPAVTGKSK